MDYNAYSKKELIERIHALQSQVHDLTESEAQCELSNQACLISEAKYRMVFENTGTATITYKDDRVILMCNTMFERLSGYTREEIEGKLSWEIFVAPEDKGRLDKYHELRSKLDDNVPREYEFDFINRYGKVKCVYIRICISPETKERIASLVDITHMKKTEEERIILIDELERKNDELARFTYVVSHELKSPLVNMDMFLNILKDDAEAGHIENIRNYVPRILAMNQTMVMRIKELLELSKKGRQLGHVEEIQLKKIVTEAVALLEEHIKSKGVKLIVDRQLPEVIGDPLRLTEVFENLISNAIKYMGDQKTPQIEIGGEVKDCKAEVFVKDNGMGIEKKNTETVFGLFKKISNESDGTGVGLALVKRIIEAHQGKIWVESEGLGKGSTFYFTLPFCKPPI